MNLRFEHVVVLMLENRSFDHLFGFLGKEGGGSSGRSGQLPKGWGLYEQGV
jgi:phospholipase C